MNFMLKRNDSKHVIEYILEEEDGSVVDLTGATVKFNVGDSLNLIISNPATIISSSLGKVSYTMTEQDTLFSGSYLGEFEVTFLDGEKKTYPRNGYLSILITKNIDSGVSNITLDSIAAKQGDFENKLDALLAKSEVAAITSAADAALEVLKNNTQVLQQPTEPTGIVEGRLWLDTSDNAYQGTVFEELQDQLTQMAQNGGNHAHLNKTVIDELSDSGGVLQYKGQPIQGGAGGGTEYLMVNTLEELQTKYPNGHTLDILVLSEKAWYEWDGAVVEPSPDTTAPTVTASPVGGTFTSVQSVTLSTNETATIYYTLDGSTPTEASTVYSAPITISESKTLKYFAKDTAGNSSTVQTQAYTINIPVDTTPPVLTITPPATFTDTQTVTMTTDETATIWYTLDDTDPITSGTRIEYTAPLTLTETDTIKAYAVDTANNASAVQTVVYTKETIPADTTAPNPVGSVAIDSSTPNTANISWTVSPSSDVSSYELSLTAVGYFTDRIIGTVDKTVTNYQYQNLYPGIQHNFIVKAVDASGNKSTSKSQTLTTGLPAANSTPFSDDFNRIGTDRNLGVSPSGQVWESDKYAISIIDGQLGLLTSNGASKGIVNTGTSDNLSVSIDYVKHASIAGYGGGLLFRYSDKNNYISLVREYTNFNLKKTEAGSTSVVRSIPTALVEGFNMKVELVGDQIKVYANDALIHTETLAFNQATGVKHGVIINNDVNVRLDNFSWAIV